MWPERLEAVALGSSVLSAGLVVVQGAVQQVPMLSVFVTEPGSVAVAVVFAAVPAPAP